MLAFPQPRHLPCPECGESLLRDAHDEHVCNDDRRQKFELTQLRGEVASFDEQLDAWFASPHGRFAAWCAERDRRPE